MPFKIVAQDKNTEARAGILTTNHGEIHTPAFMPVATKGSVKTVSVEELREIGAEMIISNALHLYVRPGLENLKRVGGLHNFMRWDGAIITDSGGFQIIRDGFNIRISDEGLHYKDYYNGANRLYTPEVCMDMHKAIGADVAMLLDDCPKHDATPAKVKEATQRSVDWARRGVEYGRKIGVPQIFAITQGGTNSELRAWCTEQMEKLDPDGYGIGGLSIGETKEEMMRLLSESTHLLPKHKPRYLMGVGSIRELLDSVALGVDVFDSTFPTQCARHGTIFTHDGRFNMRGQKLESDDRPLDEKCGCSVCKKYSRSYINHLLREHEMLGMRLASIHNLYVLLNLVREARKAIVEGRYEAFKKEYLAAHDARAEEKQAKKTAAKI